MYISILFVLLWTGFNVHFNYCKRDQYRILILFKTKFFLVLDLELSSLEISITYYFSMYNIRKTFYFNWMIFNFILVFYCIQIL